MQDDAEAKMMVLALGGPHLEWTDGSSIGRWDSQRLEAIGELGEAAKDLYCIEDASMQGNRSRFVAFRALYHSSTANIATHIYKTLDAAKAACERHHATGKWD